MNASIDITDALPFLVGLMGGGVAVTLLAQAIKKVFGLDSGHVIHLMVVAVSVALAGAQYVLQLKNLPVEVLGISSTTIYGVSQFVYNEAPRVASLLKRIQFADANPAPLVPLGGVASAEPADAPLSAAAEPAEPVSTEFSA